MDLKDGYVYMKSMREVPSHTTDKCEKNTEHQIGSSFSDKFVVASTSEKKVKPYGTTSLKKVKVPEATKQPNCLSVLKTTGNERAENYDSEQSERKRNLYESHAEERVNSSGHVVCLDDISSNDNGQTSQCLGRGRTVRGLTGRGRTGRGHTGRGHTGRGFKIKHRRRKRSKSSCRNQEVLYRVSYTDEEKKHLENRKIGCSAPLNTNQFIMAGYSPKLQLSFSPAGSPSLVETHARNAESFNETYETFRKERHSRMTRKDWIKEYVFLVLQIESFKRKLKEMKTDNDAYLKTLGDQTIEERHEQAKWEYIMVAKEKARIDGTEGELIMPWNKDPPTEDSTEDQ